jgi:hypothetical protein
MNLFPKYLVIVMMTGIVFINEDILHMYYCVLYGTDAHFNR